MARRAEAFSVLAAAFGGGKGWSKSTSDKDTIKNESLIDGLLNMLIIFQEVPGTIWIAINDCKLLPVNLIFTLILANKLEAKLLPSECQFITNMLYT